MKLVESRFWSALGLNVAAFYHNSEAGSAALVFGFPLQSLRSTRQVLQIQVLTTAECRLAGQSQAVLLTHT